MNDLENLKEALRYGPHGLDVGTLAYIMWTALEVIEGQGFLIREYEHHIDNELTIEELKLKCQVRCYSILRPMAS